VEKNEPTDNRTSKGGRSIAPDDSPTPTAGLTRRGFVRTAVKATLALAALTAAVAAALDLASCTPDEEENEMTTSENNVSTGEKSDVFVVRDTDGTDDGVTRLTSLMEANGLSFYQTAAAPEGLIATDDVVLIKINCQWAERGGTNTDLLEKVALAIAAHPDGFTGEIIVADNGQAQFGTRNQGGRLDWAATNSQDRELSALDVVAELKPKMRISGSLWDEFTMNRVEEFIDGDTADGFVIEDGKHSTGIIISYAKFTTDYNTRVSFKNGIYDASTKNYDSNRLKIINLPVLKVHMLFQVTGAVKAYMGTTASRLTNQAAHNSVGTGGMGTQMALTRMPALNIMDMIWVGVASGPGITYGNARQNNMIAASTDPVALDWWCTREVLMPLVEAGGGRTNILDPDATNTGSFGRWLALSADELVKARHAANRGSMVQVFE